MVEYKNESIVFRSISIKKCIKSEHLLVQKDIIFIIVYYRISVNKNLPESQPQIASTHVYSHHNRLPLSVIKSCLQLIKRSIRGKCFIIY